MFTSLNRSLSVVLLVVLVIFAAACAPAPTPAPTAVSTSRSIATVVPPPMPSATKLPSDYASKMISAAQGGSVQLSDGTRVDVPPGALTADTLISISVKQPPEDLRDGSFVPPLFPEFGPSGMRFQKPVKVTVPYAMVDMSDAITPDAIVIGRLEGGNWEYVGGTLNRAEKTLVADVATFSQYVPVKMLAADKWEDVLRRLEEAKFTANYFDSAYVDIANKIYDLPGGWKVVNLPDYYTASSIGDRKIKIDRSYFETSKPAGQLPSAKKNLLAGVVLGHEMAHDVHQDPALYSNRSKSTGLVTSGLYALEDAYKRLDLQALGAYFQLQLEMNQYKKTGDYSKLLENTQKILNKYGGKFATNPVCQQLRTFELNADRDGVARASERSDKWATKQPPETDSDVQAQVKLVFISFIKTTPEGCDHPSGEERARAIQGTLPTNDGGLYGSVSVEGCGKADIRVTAPNGKWTATDGDGRFLLAPIPEGTSTVTLSKVGYQPQELRPQDAKNIAVQVPTKDLVEGTLTYNCVPIPTPAPPPQVSCLLLNIIKREPQDGQVFSGRGMIFEWWTNYRLQPGESFDFWIAPEGNYRPVSLGPGRYNPRNGGWEIAVEGVAAWPRGIYEWTVFVVTSDGRNRSCLVGPFWFVLTDRGPSGPPPPPSSSSSRSR